MFSGKYFNLLAITCLTSVSIFASFVYFNILYNMKKQTTIEDTPDENTLYIEQRKKKFLDSYDIEKNFNENIEKEFYHKETYNSIMSTNNNALENSWKQRILYENTPYGYVIMYYDAYKQGFAYYANDIIPYNILNAVAMKYSIIFFCRDFFIDDSIVPSKYESPFLHVHEIDIVKKTNKIDVKNGPFAKFKKYDKSTERKNVIDKKEYAKIVKQEQERDVIKNKFISLGKCYRYVALKNTYQKKQVQLAKIPMSYSGYKQWHNPERFEIEL